MILSSVVEYYINYGEPVGSKYLVTALPFAVSSATVRNEMALLSELGFLEQPYTSAGRIPSDMGFRYYVDRLMPRLSPSNAEMFRIMSSVDQTQGDAAMILGDACSVLSELTGTLAIATTPYASDAIIKSIQAVPVSEKTAMIVVTTSAGVLKSRVAKLPDKTDYSVYELFYGTVGANFLDTPAHTVTRAKLQTVAASLGSQALALTPLLVCLYEAICECVEADTVVRGQKSLISQPGLKDSAESILGFTENSDGMLDFLRNGRKSATDIKIGKENALSFMRRASVVTSTYRAGDNEAGIIGVIGSSVMDYSHIVPLVEYMSEIIGKLITDNNS